jgi:uncharacterized protein involved in exopolysaccharide biosynthesis
MSLVTPEPPVEECEVEALVAERAAAPKRTRAEIWFLRVVIVAVGVVLGAIAAVIAGLAMEWVEIVC